MHTPSYLKPGDTIGIAAPAGKVNPDNIKLAIKILESWDLVVNCSPNLLNADHTFSGTDQQRLEDLQLMLDDPKLKAILCARGGYGSIRIIDRLDFSSFIKHPKWVVGFSDITVLHAHINFNFGLPTLHGPMPNTFPKTDSTSLEYLKQALFGELKKYKIDGNQLNLPGTAKGMITGGNLNILHNLKGTASGFDPKDKILLVEDVDEYLYQIDRNLWGLGRTYDLSLLSGVIVGTFSNLKDNDTPFGKNLNEIIIDHFGHLGIPVAFGFPAGHENLNHPLYLGTPVKLNVSESSSALEFL